MNKRYRLCDVEEAVSEMEELMDIADDIAEIDDDMQIVISGWSVYVESLNLTLRFRPLVIIMNSSARNEANLAKSPNGRNENEKKSISSNYGSSYGSIHGWLWRIHIRV